MSRYIERKEINRQYLKLKAETYGNIHEILTLEEILKLTLTAMDTCPTADVVEVVRCKDCKYYVYDEYPVIYNQTRIVEYCNKTGYCVRKNDFCSYGVRKEDTE